MERVTKGSGFKAYIKLNIPYEWEQVLRKHKAFSKFVDVVYLHAKKGTVGYSSVYHKHNRMGEMIRAILSNPSWLKAFLRAYYKDSMEQMIEELNTLIYNEQ